MGDRLQAFFLPTPGGLPGHRFCLFHPAKGDTARGCVVYIHPFAEEMNKARRMAALQAQALAREGFAVLQIDLLGCGDSSGDFGDATWRAWLDDVASACWWLRKHGVGTGGQGVPLWLWGLRAGCLLAAEVATAWNEPCHLLFWQPPAAGRLLLQQFLRLKVAGDVIDGKAKGAMESMRRQLAAGESVDIAGYRLSADLAAGLEKSSAQPAAAHAGKVERLAVLELSTRQDASLGPATEKLAAQWRAAGVAVCSQIVNGPAFWQTTEIEDAPALVAATTALISGAWPAQAGPAA